MTSHPVRELFQPPLRYPLILSERAFGKGSPPGLQQQQESRLLRARNRAEPQLLGGDGQSDLYAAPRMIRAEEAQRLQRFWPLHHLAFKFLNLSIMLTCQYN